MTVMTMKKTYLCNRGNGKCYLEITVNSKAGMKLKDIQTFALALPTDIEKAFRSLSTQRDLSFGFKGDGQPSETIIRGGKGGLEFISGFFFQMVGGSPEDFDVAERVLIEQGWVSRRKKPNLRLVKGKELEAIWFEK